MPCGVLGLLLLHATCHVVHLLTTRCFNISSCLLRVLCSTVYFSLNAISWQQRAVPHELLFYNRMPKQNRALEMHSLDCCLLLSICVIFRCVLHPLPLPLSSCLGCIPPLIGLPSLRFYAVGSSLFLLSVCFCLCSLFYRDDVLCWLLLARPFLYAFHAHLRFPVDLVWFRLSCDHGWIRSGSVNVRKQQQLHDEQNEVSCDTDDQLALPFLFDMRHGGGGGQGTSELNTQIHETHATPDR